MKTYIVTYLTRRMTITNCLIHAENWNMAYRKACSLFGSCYVKYIAEYQDKFFVE